MGDGLFPTPQQLFSRARVRKPMTEKPRRPILHLKFPPSAPIVAAPVAAAPKAQTWKCKPCGQAFEVASDLTDEECR